MKTMNKVFLIGNLGNDPELKTSENGHPFTRLNLATHRMKGKGEDAESVAQWHSVYVWGKTAEICCNCLSKGALVFVEGEMRQVQGQKDSESRPFSIVHANEVKFLTSKQGTLDNLGRSRNHDAVAQR